MRPNNEPVIGLDHQYDPLEPHRFALDTDSEYVGQGTYGTVYRALDYRQNDKIVAIKAQKLGRPDSMLRAMQRQEAFIHASISSHPYIVTLHGAYVDDENLYHAMELVEGTDLYDAAAGGILAGQTELIREGFLQMIAALRAMHDKGFYHRDIKPENILVSADGRSWRLCDFGLASANETSRWSGWGTDGYRAPECPSGEYRNEPADVWALGVTLFVAVTKCAPWGEAKPEDPCYRAFLKDGPKYLLRAANLTPEFYRLVQRFFEVDPERRITLHEAEVALRSLMAFTMDEAVDLDSYLQFRLPATLDPPAQQTPSLAISSTSSQSSMSFDTPSPHSRRPIPSKRILTEELDALHLADGILVA
ncbi:kinase-like domain-containing protein [Schizophyllum commune]